MKLKLFLLAIFLLSLLTLSAQTVVRMERVGGVYVMPCEVNGLSLRFIFDTGASDVSISLTEALFMLKNGYLSESDLGGTEYYRIANGDIAEGTEIILREVKIGEVKLYDIKASIVHELSAPLLLGQSALSRLGKIEFDYSTSTLTIRNGQNYYDDSESEVNTIRKNRNEGSYYSSDGSYSGYYMFKTSFDKPVFEVPLRDEPSITGRVLYECPKDAVVFVIDNSGQEYFNVFVNGNIGYLRSDFLERKR